MEKNDYTHISNLQQLQQARQRLKHVIELKELELKRDATACKDALNPITYINRVLDKIYSMEYLIKYIAKGYDFVKKIFNGTSVQEPQKETPKETPIETTDGNN